jgi:hypothetical protein
MTDTINEPAETKPKMTVVWDAPAPVQDTLGNLDWGYYEPTRFPFEPANAPDRQPNHGEVMSALSELLSLVRQNYSGFTALVSPDMGIEQGSYDRPDLMPFIQMSLACLKGVKDELRYGPKRTALDPETGKWKVIIPHMDVQVEARKVGKIDKVV